MPMTQQPLSSRNTRIALDGHWRSAHLPLSLRLARSSIPPRFRALDTSKSFRMAHGHPAWQIGTARGSMQSSLGDDTFDRVLQFLLVNFEAVIARRGASNTQQLHCGRDECEVKKLKLTDE